MSKLDGHAEDLPLLSTLNDKRFGIVFIPEGGGLKAVQFPLTHLAQIRRARYCRGVFSRRSASARPSQ
jgi:hypothetical protein